MAINASVQRIDHAVIIYVVMLNECIDKLACLTASYAIVQQMQ
jgi:hypothetical protein